MSAEVHNQHNVLNWPTEKYSILYCDPPWSFNAWSDKAHRHVTKQYATMTFDKIKALPVKGIAADDSVLFLWVTFPNLVECLEVIPAWGFCVSPDTRVLTRDLRWCPAEEIQVGDRLLGFDDKHVPHSIGDKGRRYFRDANVLSTGIEYLDSYEVRLSDGTNLRCSAEHPWLVKGSVTPASGECSCDKANWIRPSEMANTLKHPRRKLPLEMVRVTPLATPRNDYRSGFLSAAFDAEGSLNLQKAPVLSFAQNENPLLLRVEDYLQALGYPIHRYVTTDIPHVNLRGGMDISFRFLMEMRPPRLLDKWSRAPIDHISIYNREKVPVEEVRHIGKQAMVTLMTSSGTYVAEGFGAHNTYKTCAFSWIKTNKQSPSLFTGMGYYNRSNCEVCLLATRGKPLPRMSHSVHSVVMSPVGKHSRKPPEVRDRIVELFGDLPRIEIFGRQSTPGWAVWGNQVDEDIPLLAGCAEYAQR